MLENKRTIDSLAIEVAVYSRPSEHDTVQFIWRSIGDGVPGNSG
jgi:hypothetical protein